MDSINVDNSTEKRETTSDNTPIRRLFDTGNHNKQQLNTFNDSFNNDYGVV